jgi:hypothetical protein
MLLVQVGCRRKTHEELGAVGIGTSISHRHQTLVSMRVPNLLIIEFVTIDGNTTSAVLSSGIATLGHEALYHSVELVSLVVET